eukprot:GHVH01012040.1.p1 GENE.GHVH01012040.1~~GHVH01012040.1.p1  ORF type:complete len:752 (+),score=116.22 GHVH01012040.1:69-2324(+)
MKNIGEVAISEKLDSFIDDIIHCHGGGSLIDKTKFINGIVDAVNGFGPRINDLISRRSELQSLLGKCPNTADSAEDYLREIGYIEADAGPISCSTDSESVDREIKAIAGPQLVVPLTNSRYALNAANSRWMSLYDCLYGSNFFDSGDDKALKCVDFAMKALDDWLPLQSGSWSGTSVPANLRVEDDKMKVGNVDLQQQDQYIGFRTNEKYLKCFLFRHNDLMIELVLDRNDALGSEHPLGICDVRLESAITTIMDGEDSVAVVDEEDKLSLYSNWRRVLEGSLTATFQKNGKEVCRTLNSDFEVEDRDGDSLTIPGRGVLLVRTVGLHILSDVVKRAGKMVPETIIDVFVFGLISYLIDVLPMKTQKKNVYSNSRTGSVYMVIPKMHGSKEVELIVELFSKVERVIGAPKNTLKLGIMDEERRTSCNLLNCVKKAHDRVIFINTGFLDRTGDNIASLMSNGAVPTKAQIKQSTWLSTYESRNVSVGIHFGLAGRAQIGKGMWAAPDALKEMYAEKIGHVKSGATTAWVPSPTGACLHALHYHMFDVQKIVKDKSTLDLIPLGGLLANCFMEPDERELWTSTMMKNLDAFGGDEKKYCRAGLDALTTSGSSESYLKNDTILVEVLNNVQCIVGYASRWIILGIGCSKIPNMSGLGLMEDRATLRISSQHLANWLCSGVISHELVQAAIDVIVSAIDLQNSNEEGWKSIVDVNYPHAMNGIVDLCLHGEKMPNGYTETTLYTSRRLHKLAMSA